MAKKVGTTIGLEYDNFGVRAARAGVEEVGGDYLSSIEAVEEVQGDFSREEQLIAGIREIKDKIEIGPNDKIVTCVTGKQIYAGQINFRRLADEEMKNALRFEMRKNLPFEISSATIDFNIIDAGDKKNDRVNVLVAVAANALMNNQLRALEKAGLKPRAMDILPVTVANALWLGLGKQPEPGAAGVALHIGPRISTLVFDGENASFFHRSIYFNACDLFGNTKSEMSDRERGSRINSLIDEIVRSLAFYEQTYKVSQFLFLQIMGEYSFYKELAESLAKNVSLKINPHSVLEISGYKTKAPFGKFDAAVALAMHA
ncbi:MAG: hypothetical protein GF350_09635 [Chitinivibrionales bacterium]|nr:hypothetical protein [Chitinivibrionales bacterium]